MGRAVAKSERLRKAVRMRVEERPWEEIVSECGYKNVASAQSAVSQELSKQYKETVEDARTMELRKLAEMEAEVWKIANKSHILVRGDGPVIDPVSGERIYDDGPKLSAMDRLLKLAERRAKVLGIDQPDQVDHRMAVIHISGVGVGE